MLTPATKHEMDRQLTEFAETKHDERIQGYLRRCWLRSPAIYRLMFGCDFQEITVTDAKGGPNARS